jgi:hypothetical protein
MAADTLTTGVPSGDVRGATAPSRRALQAGAAPGTVNTPGAEDHSEAGLPRWAAMPDGSGSLQVALGKWFGQFTQVESAFHLTDLPDHLACRTRVSPPSTSILTVSATWQSAELTAAGPACACGSSVRHRATCKVRCSGDPGRARLALSPGAMLRPATLARVVVHPPTCEPA